MKAEEIKTETEKVKKLAKELTKEKSQNEINQILDDILEKVYDKISQQDIDFLSELFNEVAKYLKKSKFFIVEETEEGHKVLDKQYVNEKSMTKYLLKNPRTIGINKKGHIYIHKNEKGIWFIV